MQHPIGQTRNGAYVYVDLINSPAAKHIAVQPQLLTLAKEMLGQITVQGPAISVEYDMRRPIGYSFIVATTDDDTVLYGRFVKDEVYTRFVKKRIPLLTQYLTITLAQKSRGNYELSDIWIGSIRPPRPGSTNETAKSKPFWSSHAFVFNNQPMQLQTITTTCPY